MSSSSSRAAGQSTWAPRLDLTPKGLSQFDPARVQHAIEEGYEAGRHAGHAEALAAGREALQAELAEFRADASEVLAALAAVSERVARSEDRAAQDFAAHVVDAAMQIAEAIIGRELADETVAAASAVERALTGIDRKAEAHIQMHPDDIEQLQGVSVPATIHLEPNPGMRRGDAIATTDDRTVDARIGTALDRARAVLEGHA